MSVNWQGYRLNGLGKRLMSSRNTLRTGDANLHFYITTAQDGWRKSAFLTRLFSPHSTLNYAIHGACLWMVLLTDVYRNLTSLWIKPRECAFKQFKSPVINVLRHPGWHQPSFLFSSCSGSRVELLRCDNDHLPPSGADIKKEKLCVCSHCMPSWCVQGNFTFFKTKTFCHLKIST
jgi:hypothetical protein